MKKILLLSLAAVAMLTSCGNQSPKISGAGATFPAPYYNLAFKEFTKTSAIDVTYGAIGSGGGIRSLKDKTADFGATDVFLSEEERSEMGAEVLHVPTALGAVVLSYKLEGIDNLNLTAEVISDIFRGKITKWNDVKLASINPGVVLPDKAITPVYRSDGSGTTYVFSDYMTKADSLWSVDLGRGKSLNFSVGVAAKGNPGVAGIVAETEGSIGYIGSEYAFALSLKVAKLQNKSGNFIEANNNSISAAANVEIPDNTCTMITDSDNPEAYPISTFTWIILYKEQAYNDRTQEQAKSLVSLLNFMIGEQGQDLAAKTHYSPLKGIALEKTKAVVNSIQYNGQPVSQN
ncbi:phosphate ABC transporter substrate-binding protein PstS [Dysgonomonas massiliensis]|uniref:phosphate ABC transporter substrate-binding protein PstS n=1 Tax=Dysgonomonas massiliensis TaxID=2040292 RepID=UPI000C772972|nr:phosphate ABC transporter substrate-binding protein PstS [Dysgonomonas massiliensis]